MPEFAPSPFLLFQVHHRDPDTPFPTKNEGRVLAVKLTSERLKQFLGLFLLAERLEDNPDAPICTLETAALVPFLLFDERELRAVPSLDAWANRFFSADQYCDQTTALLLPPHDLPAPALEAGAEGMECPLGFVLEERHVAFVTMDALADPAPWRPAEVEVVSQAFPFELLRQAAARYL